MHPFCEHPFLSTYLLSYSSGGRRPHVNQVSWLESSNLASIQIIYTKEREQQMFTYLNGQGDVNLSKITGTLNYSFKCLIEYHISQNIFCSSSASDSFDSESCPLRWTLCAKLLGINQAYITRRLVQKPEGWTLNVERRGLRLLMIYSTIFLSFQKRRPFDRHYKYIR